MLLSSLLVAASLFNIPDSTAIEARYRPKFHFTPPKNWVNDPNGLIYSAGEYHLFYQHNPFGNKWGNMSWGHAVSKDLLHWKPLPVAIPEFTHADSKAGQPAVKTAIFSGGAVMDRGNKNGLCPDGTTDCMVALYTGNVMAGDKQLAQYQNMAYSADKGRTWTQYAKNPIIDVGSKEFRDPNVFWYAPDKKWVMATVKATEHRAAFYASKDLKNWEFMSYFGPTGDTTKVWECPALMPVPIQNEPGKSKWVLCISAGHPKKDYVGIQYFVGDFDGKQFRLDPVAQPKSVTPGFAGTVVDWGKDYYAAVPFNDVPGTDKRPVMIGWLNNWAYAGALPTTPYKGGMSLPRRVSLKRTVNGLVLIQQPISEVTTLRGTNVSRPTVRLTNRSQFLEKSTNNAYELTMDLVPGSAKTIGIRLAKNGNEETVLQYADGKLQFDRRRSGNVQFSKPFASVEEAPLTPKNGVIRLRIFVDKSVVEVYANEGERVITDLIFPTQATGGIELFTEGGTGEFRNVTLWSINE